MSDLEKILTENQKRMLKLVASTAKQTINPQNSKDSDSEFYRTRLTAGDKMDL